MDSVDKNKGRKFICARWAIVAFIDSHNIEALPRSETHKWYREKEAEGAWSFDRRVLFFMRTL